MIRIYKKPETRFVQIRPYLLSIVTILTLLAPVLVPMTVYAVKDCTGATTSGLQTGANLGSTNHVVNCGKKNVGNKAITKLAKQVVNIFSIVVGAISVIMIIYGGFRYITSGGASEGVGNAKKTLLYAIIGLIVVALAQLIIHFVLNQTNTINSGS